MKPVSIAVAAMAIAILFFAGSGLSPGQDEESQRHLLHELGGPFFVSRDKVQNDLKLSEGQRQKLRNKLSVDIQSAAAVEAMKPGEREPAMLSLRQRSAEGLETFLKETLTADQWTRFSQLKLQYDVPSILLQPGIGKELGITDEQRKQFMNLIHEMQKKMLPMMKDARNGGNQAEILAQVTKLRLDCQAKIEALLSEPQKKQWQDMTGPPLVIW
jgi:Spy/CpxP family protein refolding chaperone